jgi:glycosyltransferase involved in cell wall biosynthesis
VIYLPISQSAPGFLRDSLFIHIAHARGWKIAVHLRGSEFHLFHRSSPALLRRWIKFTLKRVDSVAVMGASLTRVLDDLVAPERVAIVPNGTPEPNTDGVMCDENLVLFLSNLWRRKGVVEALEAALLVVRDRPASRFLFVGEWESPELERQMRERAMACHNVRFLTTQTGDEKDRLLASSSLLLFPPREPEGHPRVVLEALAAGVPVVTTDRGAISETVVDGESGYVIDQPEPEKLAAHVSSILNDPAKRARMSRSARNRYLAEFTQEKADRRLVEWLETVAAVR